MFGQRLLQEILENMDEGLYSTDQDHRIVQWNNAAENITGHSSSEAMNRLYQEEILMYMDEEGNLLSYENTPLALTIKDGVPREQTLYLLHREGHRVPVLARTLVRKDAEDRVVGGVEILGDLSHQGHLKVQAIQLKPLSMLDHTTNLPNRRYIENRMERLEKNFRKTGAPWGAIVFDIDKFYELRTTLDKEVFHSLLRMTGKTLSFAIKAYDSMARWGENRFIGIFPETALKDLEKTARKLQGLVRQSGLPQKDSPPIGLTVSVGGTLAREEEGMVETLERVFHFMLQGETKQESFILHE